LTESYLLAWIRLIKEEFQALKVETYELQRLCSGVSLWNAHTPELIRIIKIITLLKDIRLAILMGKETTIEIPKLYHNKYDIYGHRKIQDSSGEWIHDSFKKYVKSLSLLPLLGIDYLHNFEILHAIWNPILIAEKHSV
jgi:hypothetical protein